LVKAGVLSNFRGDSAAALNVVIVSAPTAIGVGLVATMSLGSDYSALGALAGLIGLIAATLVCSFAGASRFQFNAPGSAAAGLLSGLGGTIVGDARVAEALSVSPAELPIVALNAMMLCTALVGVMQILIGQLRLGNLIKLVPHTVITGIMNGIIVLVAFHQLPWLLGLDNDPSMTFGARLFAGINHFDLMIGVSTMLSIYLSKRWLPRLPSLLIGMLTGTLSYWALNHLGAESGSIILGPTVGALPAGLPTPARSADILALALNDGIMVIGPAIFVAAVAITLVTSIGGLVTAAAADALTNNRHNPVGELTGLGAGNFVAAIFSGIPSGGSPTNVLLNYQSGGRTRLAHVLASLLLIGCVLGLGAMIAVIPLSVIAGALIVMSFQTFDTWPLQLAKKALSMRRSELWRNICFNLGLVSIVMLLIIFADLVTAVLTGLVLELLHFLIKSSKSLVRQQLGGSVLHSNVVRDNQAMKLLDEKGDAIQIISLQGTLFFGNTDYLANYLESIMPSVTTVLVDFKRVSDIDSSGVLVLSKIDRRLSAQNKTLLLTGLPANGAMLDLLREFGLTLPMSSDRVFDELNAGLAQAERQLLSAYGHEDFTDSELNLADTVAFTSLTDTELTMLVLERREFEAGALIITEGDLADGLYVLVKGRVSILKTRENDTVYSLVEFGPGVNLGEMAIFSGALRTANVQALAPAVLYFMSLLAFEQLCVDQPLVAVTIMKNISGSLSRRLAEASITIAELESA
jgi:SulP family sulfate permease